MDEIFGRVTAILFAAAVFMGMPLLYMSERAKSAEQMYLLTVNTGQHLQYRFFDDGNVSAVL